MRSVWTVIILAILLGGLAAVRGAFNTKTLVALVALVLIGALWPPAGVVLGGVALLVVGLTHGPALIQQVTGGKLSSSSQQSS